MSMEGEQFFRPGPEHKKVSDLPEDQQDKYVDLPKGGFVMKNAAEIYEYNKSSEEFLNKQDEKQEDIFDKIANKFGKKNKKERDFTHGQALYDNDIFENNKKYEEYLVNEKIPKYTSELNKIIDKGNSVNSARDFIELFRDLHSIDLEEEDLIFKDSFGNKYSYENLNKIPSFKEYYNLFEQAVSQFKDKWLNLCKTSYDFYSFYSAKWTRYFNAAADRDEYESNYVNKINTDVLEKWFDLCKDTSDIRDMNKILEKRNSMGFIYEKLLESKK